MPTAPARTRTTQPPLVPPRRPAAAGAPEPQTSPDPAAADHRAAGTERVRAPRRPPLLMRGIWALFHPGETLRCTQCERGFGEVHQGTDAMVRVTPATSDGVRPHLSHRCDRCRAMLQVVVVDTDDVVGADEQEAPPC